MSSRENHFVPTACMKVLRQRSMLLGKIREYFDQREFVHVETPLLSRETVVDRYIDPVAVDASNLLDDATGEFYLQTSPEFAMKRLLASGATAIYQICKAFRRGESGRRHNPEFTMLEWYRVGDDLVAGMDLLADFAQHIFDAEQVNTISYSEAYLAHAKMDPFSASIAELKSVCDVNNIDTTSFSDDHDRDSWLNLIMSEIVEPRLGSPYPEIVFHWPANQAALARTVSSPEGYEVAERFELFFGGYELANGYHELLDAEELLRRNEHVNQQRLQDGRQSLPTQSKLIDAMRHGLPPCSGVALGIDRLLMLLLEKDSIDEVLAFPIERA